MSDSFYFTLPEFFFLVGKRRYGISLCVPLVGVGLLRVFVLFQDAGIIGKKQAPDDLLFDGFLDFVRIPDQTDIFLHEEAGFGLAVNINPIIIHINIRFYFPVRFVGKKGCRNYQIIIPYFLFQLGINIIPSRQTEGERMFSSPVIKGFEPHVLQKPGEFPDGGGGLLVLLKACRALQGRIGVGLIALPDHQADNTRAYR
ncbi:hypothetical protein ABGM91_08235 [Akkermansia muciniphila]|uniref:hypothetical protein n=1 Tax=Akkermansia muciniphila TaxID=239935 RepID=UPI0033A5F556